MEIPSEVSAWQRKAQTTDPVSTPDRQRRIFRSFQRLIDIWGGGWICPDKEPSETGSQCCKPLRHHHSCDLVDLSVALAWPTGANGCPDRTNRSAVSHRDASKRVVSPNMHQVAPRLADARWMIIRVSWFLAASRDFRSGYRERWKGLDNVGGGKSAFAALTGTLFRRAP